MTRRESDTEREDPARLDPETCWELISAAPFARIAFVRPDGAPEVLPVNIHVYDHHVYLRTAPDSKLTAFVEEPRVAVEADGEDEHSRWSVIVHGTAAQVTSEAEIHRSGVERLTSWSPTVKHFAVRITPYLITGRSFAKGAHPPAAAYAVPATGMIPTQEPARADRPVAIPHYSLPPRVRDQWSTGGE